MPIDPRSYITLVDTMPEHEKAEGLSDAAFRLLIETWCWCHRQDNDGAISARAWARRGTAETRAELEHEGWVDVTPDGVQMHDYAQHQQTREARSKTSSTRAAAGKLGGLARAANMRERLAKEAADQEERSNSLANASKQTKPGQAEVEVEVEVEETPLATLAPPGGAEVAPTKPAKRAAADRGTFLPEDWQPTAADVAWCRREFPGLSDDDARQLTAGFVDWWTSKPKTARYRMVDWSKTWRNRIRDQAPRLQRRGRPGGLPDGIDWAAAEQAALEVDEARNITRGAGAR